jgi:hypothetical protein
MSNHCGLPECGPARGTTFYAAFPKCEAGRSMLPMALGAVAVA